MPSPACSCHLPVPTFACLCACAHLCLWPPMPTSFSTVLPGAGVAQLLPGLQQHHCKPLLMGWTSAPVPMTTMWCHCQLLYSEEPAIVGLLDAGAVNNTTGDWGQWAKELSSKDAQFGHFT
ncbi:hypothetical protein BJV74DRAFT_799825 [Russula compacta]|nr:hypothetical protein BJV74DRAFT_799825 [Russula compacta]